jgi:hypothetical protein
MSSRPHFSQSSASRVHLERLTDFVSTNGTHFHTGQGRVYFSGANADYLLDPSVTNVGDIKKFLKVPWVHCWPLLLELYTAKASETPRFLLRGRCSLGSVG